METVLSFITRLDRRQKLLLGGTLGCVLFVFLVRFVYLPVLGTIGERQTTLKDLRVKLVDAEVLRAQLPKQEATLAQVQERYRTLESWISGGESMPRILEALNQQAKAHRLALVTVQPPPEDDPHVVTFGPAFTLREVPLILTLTGRYWNIAEFLGDLAEAPFLTSIRSLRMGKPEPGDPQLEATMSLVVHLAEGPAQR